VCVCVCVLTWQHLRAPPTLMLRRQQILAVRGGGGGASGSGDKQENGRDGFSGPVDAVTTMEEAEELWVRAVDAAPDAVPLLFDYPLFLQDDKGDWLGAERVYKKVLAIEPTNIAAASNYATILGDHRDDLNGAECAFQWALANNQNDDKVGQLRRPCARQA